MDRRFYPLTAALALSLAAASVHAQGLGGLGATHVYGPLAHQVVIKPSDAEVMSAWPAAAKAKALNGSAVMHCVADAAGAMTDCQVMIERSHAGFGHALLSLAPRYRVKPGPSGEPADVVISATWPAPETAVDWQEKPNPGDFSTTMTSAAWRAGKGQAVMNCLVAQMGALHDCMVVYQSPPAKGFGTMALRFQGFLRLKPATVAGKPITSGEDIVFNFRQMQPGETF
jgi:hypothetical protein